MIERALLLGTALLLSLGIQSTATGDTGETDTAKLAQNPVASIISVPFQYNANLNFGPEKQTLDVLNFQPVIPFSLTQDWNVITRTILLINSEPSTVPGVARTN